MTGATDPLGAFLDLALLRYDRDDHPDRWAEATALLARQPGLPRVDVHVAAATGDVESLRRLLEEDPGRADARRADGRSPLMCFAHARVAQLDA